MPITEDIVELVRLVGNLPGDVIVGISIFVGYKLVTYLSTAGAVVYLGRKFIVKKKD